MSWSIAKTGCAGSAIFVAPICLNFGMTAPVLSCVITWRGRIETKSPACTAVPGASPSAWRAAIFSTSVRPISILQINFLSVKALEQMPLLLCFRQPRWQRRLHNFAGAIEHLRAHDKALLARERHDFVAQHSLDFGWRISHPR